MEKEEIKGVTEHGDIKVVGDLSNGSCRKSEGGGQKKNSFTCRHWELECSRGTSQQAITKHKVQ